MRLLRNKVCHWEKLVCSKMNGEIVRSYALMRNDFLKLEFETKLSGDQSCQLKLDKNDIQKSE